MEPHIYIYSERRKVVHKLNRKKTFRTPKNSESRKEKEKEKERVAVWHGELSQGAASCDECRDKSEGGYQAQRKNSN